MFDLAGPDTQFQTRDQVIQIINGIYLANCNAGIDYAYAKWVKPDLIISPNKFDAVVFMVNDVRDSLLKKIGGSAQINPKALGTTLLGATGGGLAEVYWNRCLNNYETAGAIFHEAAHLKSGQIDSMHQASGVRVLKENGGQYEYPSWNDLEFYEAAIKRPITLRTNVP